MELEQDAEVNVEENNEIDRESNVEEEDGSENNGSSESKTYTQEELDARIKEQDKRWKDRFKKSGKDSEKDGEEGQVDKDERYNRLDLKTEGITNKKEQDIILDYAKYKGVSPVEAMNTVAVKAELHELRAKNVPAPSTRTSTGSNDSYEYYAKNIKAGKLRLSDVSDAKMRQRLMSGKIFG